MADNKVNMSLDDIIKSERKNRKPGRRGVTRNIKKGKMVGARPAGSQGRGGRRSNINLNAATVNAVNRLVKKAISQRANQQLIHRAANRRVMANRGIVATRPAGFRARRSYNFSRPSGLGRLRGINQRSRVIRGPRRVQQEEPLVLSANVKTIRGRGSSRLGQLVSDDGPVYVRREVVPVEEEEEEEILEEAPPPRRFQFPRRRRQVIAQQRRRPIVVERRIATRPVVTYVPVRPNRGIAKRTRFVTVANSPVFERVQRQQNWRGRRGGPRQFVNPNAAQMREALGIGRQVQRVVERFEPSSSFLQRVPATKRKGRGFQPRY